MSSGVLRFDRFEMQLAERRLLRDGQEVPIRGRAFDVLAVLAREPGRLVSRNELLEQVWPGLVVEDSNIAAQVAAVRKALASDLISTVPGHGYRLAAPAGQAPAGKPPTATRSAVPIPLFGRADDLARLQAALAQPGCVTLTGPGGVGKTALAQAAHAAAAPSAWWCDLAPLDQGSQLRPALLRTLGRTSDAGDGAAAVPAGMLAPGALLVLDNAEHLVEAAADAVQWLRAAAPQLRVLVTSQVPLAIAGERVERLAPLQLPQDDMPDAQARQVGAMALLADRVHAADARYPLGPEATPLLRRLCAALDGLPLALEMAAARVPVLGLQGVLDGLAQRFAMLRHRQRGMPERQRTLQAALEWSHALLAEPEQDLFRALGVFSGGFTLELAVAVAGAEADAYWDVVDRLAVLVERSLVTASHDDPPRYGLLETMRHYALRQLADAGEEQAVRLRHAHAVQQLLRTAHDMPDGPDPCRPAGTRVGRDGKRARSHGLGFAARPGAVVSGSGSSAPGLASRNRYAPKLLCEKSCGTVPIVSRPYAFPPLKATVTRMSRPRTYPLTLV